MLQSAVNNVHHQTPPPMDNSDQDYYEKDVYPPGFKAIHVRNNVERRIATATHQYKYTTISSKKAPSSSASSSYRTTTTTEWLPSKLDAVLPEEMRISKLVRKLQSDMTNAPHVIEVCHRLMTAINDPNNSAYIRRTFDLLADKIISVAKLVPNEASPYVARIFGLMGYVVRADFLTYKNWIVKIFKANKELRPVVMNALRYTLILDRENREIEDYAPQLIEVLKGFLNNTDVASVFVSMTNVIQVFAANYENAFQRHFSEIVDIVIGWHLTLEQGKRIKSHCSKVLQSLEKFWCLDDKFTVKLLDMFLEDIVSSGDDTSSPSADTVNFEAIMSAFNSLIKCVWPPALLDDNAFEKVSTVCAKVLDGNQNEDFILALNEFLVIFIERSAADNAVVISIIEKQIRHLDNYGTNQTLSFLFLICKLIDSMKTTVPIAFIDLMLSFNSPMHQLKFSRERKVQRALDLMYQRVLNLKSVPHLQAAYKHIITDLDLSMSSLKFQKSYTSSQAQLLIGFYLNALSALGTAASSIIAMWALQPSILELLAERLQPTDLELWRKASTTHYSLLQLLSSHCARNNNFITSSSLLKGDCSKSIVDKLKPNEDEDAEVEKSPTSGHFQIILKFLSNFLSAATTSINEPNLNIILKWCIYLLPQLIQYEQILFKEDHFLQMIKSICFISTQNHPLTVLGQCADCLSQFLLYDFYILQDSPVMNALLKSIAETSCRHVCAIDAAVRGKFSSVLTRLPLNVSLQQLHEFTGSAREHDERTSNLQNWHTASPTQSHMRGQYFKQFIEALSFKETATSIEGLLTDMFVKCWSEPETVSGGGDFVDVALSDLRVLVSWTQWEAAQYCVNNKLKTSLGKPQDTFYKIEEVIREGAKILGLKEKSTVDNVQCLVAQQRNARFMLGFMECLEKAIYNAAEGTAFAMPPPEKPARSFFRVNASTCAEWFNRVRTAVDLVALHCIEAEMVIRYTEAILKNLTQCGRVNESLFEHTLMSHAWALLRNGESDALAGLYVWSKKVSNKKFQWIKYASEQAAGRREMAQDGYKRLLDLVHSGELQVDPHVRDFMVDQYLECRLYLFNVKDLSKFVREEEEERAHLRVTIPIISLTYKQVETFEYFDITNEMSSDAMYMWDVIDNTDKFINEFSFHKTAWLCSNTICTMSFTERETWNKDVVDIVFRLMQNAVQECLRTRSKEHLNHIITMCHIFDKVAYSRKTADGKYCTKSIDTEVTYGSAETMCSISWMNWFNHEPLYTSHMMPMRLKLCEVAREEGNYMTYIREMERCLNGSALREMFDETLTIEGVSEKLSNPSVVMQHSDIWRSETVVSLINETTHYLVAFPDTRTKGIELSASCLMGICKEIEKGGAEAGTREKAARSLLTLSEWLQNPEIKTSFNENCAVQLLLNSLPEINLPHRDASTKCSVVSELDISVGKLINHSIKQCLDLPKAWSVLGGYCFRLGRKMVEQQAECVENHAGLQPNDISAISDILENSNEADVKQIVAVLNRHQMSAEDEEIGPNNISSTELIQCQLRTIECLQQYTHEQLNAIIEIWRKAHKKVYAYYEMSADAYFKYLQLVASNQNESDEEEISSASEVTVTLRLLRLIVKHALGLQDVLEEGLALTPTRPWKVIIPQLFSRLNHHEPYVRRRVSELLCRVAKDSPHLIIFPAVVGAASQEGQQMDIADLSVHSICDVEREDENKSALTFCFNALLSTLSVQTPETVAHVQLLVKELRRVTLLWDELWLVSLAQIYSECAKRVASFDVEVQKMSTEDRHEKLALLSEKHRILMRPVLFVVERLQAITSRPTETVHEKIFQDKYEPFIEKTVSELRSPFSVDRPTRAWQQFKLLYSMLQQRAQKRNACRLRMTDISPALAEMKNTLISMPGADSEVPVYISSVDNVVHILPTKTKPKKMVFHGSDGNRYTYLFKGLEDLHLDERIMQFLSIANSMMTKSVDCFGNVTTYRARHYSVIPLGPRSGLISWVDGLTPIFALYKKWQQREALSKKINEKESQSVKRPSELYYEKLTPLLAEHGLKPTDNRKDWPVSVLKQVLKELSDETPRDLLSKELWCHSSNAAQWRRMTRNYSLSMAVMSVIGYVIGLGDRHLDNVLIELSSGEVVHIDYNVCFEKGKTLRVPERVPFRMTPNLEEALGLTGIEGTFRLACEHVLRALKRGRETLLTLLEAFVYDPLVDWAVGEDGAGGLAVSAYGGEALGGELRLARKQLEHEVTRDTLAIRFAEIKPDWIQNRDNFKKQLTTMERLLTTLEHRRNEMQTLESRRVTLSKQLAMIREADSLGSAITSHPLSTLSQRYGMVRKARDVLTTAQSQLTDRRNECETSIQSYQQAVNLLPSLEQKRIDLDCLLELTYDSEFEMAREFLENSAQHEIYNQAEMTREEIESSCLQQAVILKQALDDLTQYRQLADFYPRSIHDQHRLQKHLQSITFVQENPNDASCKEVSIQLMQSPSPKHSNYEQVLEFACHLKSLMKATTADLQRLKETSPQESLIAIEADDAKRAIVRHMSSGNEAELAMQSTLFTTLAMHSRVMLDNEMNASLAAGTMPTLMLNNKWFLDELKYNASLLNELTVLAFNHNNENGNSTINKVLHSLREASSLYDFLCTTYVSFNGDLMTEWLRGVMTEDPSVLAMISEVSEMQSDTISVENFLQNLDDYTKVIEQKESDEQLDKIFNIQSKMDQLKLRFYDSENSLGANLFLKCTNMFDRMTNRQQQLYDGINELIGIDNSWRNKISEFHEAASLMKCKWDVDVLVHQRIADAFLTVLQLETMIDFFTVCLQTTYTFKGLGDQMPFDEESLCRPIKTYYSHFVNYFLLGVTPLLTCVATVSFLDQNGVNINLIEDKIELSNLCQNAAGLVDTTAATTLNTTLNVALERNTSAHYHLNCLGLLRERLKRVQLLIQTHTWLHVYSFAENQNVVLMNRKTLLSKLRTGAQHLASWRASIEKMHQELNEFSIAILQRLRWAAGANPTVVGVLYEAFERKMNARADLIQKHLSSGYDVAAMCQSVVTYESSRFPNESLELDRSLYNLLVRLEKAFQVMSSMQNCVNPVEENLVELLDPEGAVDHNWLNNASALIDDMTDRLQNDTGLVEKAITVSQDNLQYGAHRLRGLMQLHHRLASDVRTSLKSTLKLDGIKTASVKEYLIKCKTFSDDVAELYGNVLSKDFTESIVAEMKQQIESLKPIVIDVFDGLFEITNTVGGSSVSADDVKAADQKTKKIADGKGTSSTAAEQKRNAYAMSVWRRVRMKLEGRDPDATKRCTVAEQVDWMIREARDLDNLALLYEGWTPWV